MKTLYLISTSLLLTLYPASADWRTDIGWDELQRYANDFQFSLPTGAGVYLESAEAGSSYMPDSANAAFTNITIDNISNTSSGISGHATAVSRIFYGLNTSLLSGISHVGVHSATPFINDILGKNPVGSTDAKIMNHSYISAADPNNENTLNELIKRFDFFSQDSKVINVIAMNNGNTTTIPPIWGSAYNTISVGRTDGAHSHGNTPANYPGPGRQKPDIVAPASYTSFSTPEVSSAATLLFAKGISTNNTDATHADTIKACLLAGATKAEFESWSQTSTKPLDSVFGAGELNIFHSYRILEKPESNPGNVFFRGWSRNTVAENTSRTYTFTTPNYHSPQLSAALIWQRDVTKSWFGYTYQPLANLKLELLDASGNVIQTSDSNLDNVEHIWNTHLTPNTTYKLKVSSASSSTTSFSLAWRVNGTPLRKIVLSLSGNDVVLNFSELYINTPYTVQKSSDMHTWADVHTFTATNSTSSWTDSNAASSNAPIFYRLRFFAP